MVSEIVVEPSMVVLRTRTGEVWTTAQTLAECTCDYFDSFLCDTWPPALDDKGRRTLYLDFDDAVFRNTLMRMQAGVPSQPPPMEDVWAQEQLRQLHYLCHRPTFAAEEICEAEAAAKAEEARKAFNAEAAAAKAAEAIAFRPVADAHRHVVAGSWRDLLTFTISYKRDAERLEATQDFAGAVEKLQTCADLWNYTAISPRFESFAVMQGTAREAAAAFLLQARQVQARRLAGLEARNR